MRGLVGWLVLSLVGPFFRLDRISNPLYAIVQRST